jgi:hypothetical protein
MFNGRKSNSNRANAQASTGPKTLRGKAHAAQNARRHGLSLPVISDPALSEEVGVLARQIAGEAPIAIFISWLAALRKRNSICNASGARDINFYPHRNAQTSSYPFCGKRQSGY